MQLKNFLLCIMLLCAGCSSRSQGDLVETKYLPDGGMERISYSFLYIAQEIVIPGVLGVFLDIDQHSKKVIPFLDLLQRATGTLGPDDLRSKGSCRGILINLSKAPLGVEVISLKRFYQAPLGTEAISLKRLNHELLNNPLTLRLEPQHSSVFFMEDIDIGTYDKKQELTLTINYQGKQYVKDISLPRLTNDDWVKKDAMAKRVTKLMQDNNMTYADYFYMMNE